MNPLINMIGAGNSGAPAIMQAMQMIGQIRKAGNPRAAVEQMAKSNANVKNALDMCNGKNPKQVFETMCRKNGMDPAQIESMLK